MALRSTTNTTDLYFVASTARSKLGKEACRESHRLRHLVGHANILDDLMVELNQIKNEPACNSRRSSRELEEIPELQEDSSDDDSEDELELARYPVRSPAQVKSVATAELKPQLRLNEAIRTAQRQHFSPSLDSIIETAALSGVASECGRVLRGGLGSSPRVGINLWLGPLDCGRQVLLLACRARVGLEGRCLPLHGGRRVVIGYGRRVCDVPRGSES